MDKQLNLKNIALIGRTFEEYYNMFDLDDLDGNEIILDVASGVSSFCAQAHRQGFNVTASDKIFSLSPYEIEQKCKQDLDMIIKQMPEIVDLFVWNYFKNIESLKNQREKAYKLFIEDFRKYGTRRYVPVEYPVTDFGCLQISINRVRYEFMKNGNEMMVIRK